MTACVLDASALVAYLDRESGYRVVEPLLDDAGVNVINVAEVASKLFERGASPDRTRETLRSLGVEIIPCDETLAFEIGRLRPVTKPLGLSLGDRACLATALWLGVPAVTADRHWKSLKVGVRIHVIR